MCLLLTSVFCDSETAGRVEISGVVSYVVGTFVMKTLSVDLKIQSLHVTHSV